MTVFKCLILLFLLFDLEARNIFSRLFGSKSTEKIKIESSKTINNSSDIQNIKTPVLAKVFRVLDIPIRVLLKESKDDFTWEILVDGGVTIYIENNKKIVSKKFDSNKITIKKSALNISINGISIVSEKIFLVPNKFIVDSNLNNLTFSINDIKYDGICVIHFNNVHNTWNLINYLDLEDYVASVIYGESWPGWPDEVNKALSICYRTYGITKVFEKKRVPYDIKNHNGHQVYKGSVNPQKFKKLVESTKHTVVSWDNKPILAMFDIACGNIIPAKKLGLDYEKAPYLGRNYACNHCKSYKHNFWELKYSLEEVANIINNQLKIPGRVRDIIVSKKDKSGCVTELKASVNYKWVPISAKSFKSVFKKLKSLNFTIKKYRNTFTFKGRGYGHLSGLCQQGAYQMVLKGYSYKDILNFYYPKTELKKLSKI